MRSQRTADEHARQALLKKSRFNEVLQQYSAHLPVEACLLRSVGGSESCAGVQEEIPDTRERFFDTSRLAWLRHGRFAKTRVGQWRRLHSRITAPRRAGVLMKVMRDKP
jgi:hypothetical protein